MGGAEVGIGKVNSAGVWGWRYWGAVLEVWSGLVCIGQAYRVQELYPREYPSVEGGYHEDMVSWWGKTCSLRRAVGRASLLLQEPA